MEEKELRLEIGGKVYAVTIKAFTAYEARIAVEGKEYTVGLKDLGIDQVPDIKPVRVPHASDTESAPKPRTASSGAKASANPIVLHRPSSVVNTLSVIAPLPGQIQKILVRVGDVIHLGQTVLILEAMKMENEIHSNSEGIVKEIRCQQGDSVNQGDLLIVLDHLEE
ncbi:MAG TPA: biotin/lipoyl-binding protein [bacterium]|nr:biotin/lipoyl-binding protein [bacterium]HNT64979.1 biotin/lipoyl-binding protein [bacterium]